MTWTQQEKVKDELMKEREACYRINKWGSQRRKGEQEGERIDLIGFPPGMLALWRKEAEEEMERLTEMRGGKKMGKASKTPSEVGVYKHVRREEKGMEHLEHCSSEEVCQISCFLLFAFTWNRKGVCVCVCQYQWVLNLSVHLSHRSRFLIILLW